jgi:cation diffusion facilitator CzcD-associated flavoprotein CzcO
VSAPLPQHVHVAIVGAGFSGMGAAIRLRRAGFTDLVILERAEDVGGVWRDNLYPGCACDVQSHLYSFSFAPNAGWTRAYSPQREILGYLQDCADRFDVRPLVRFGTALTSARREGDRWRIATSRGELTADVLVLATGALSEPAVPDIPGLATFPGTVMHTARWDPAVDLAGQRVAVIGTGASAIQAVPELQPVVRELVLVQRTPPWVLPHLDHAIPGWARRMYRAFPFLQRASRALIQAAREMLALGFLHPAILRAAHRFARWNLARQVPDPALRARLTPDYTLGCKRVLLSDRYLPALTRPNVRVVDGPVREIRGRVLVTPEGEHGVDAIVLATGFRVLDMPIAGAVHGSDGRSLADVWAGSPRAHLGLTVTGFPGLFLLLGPGTGVGHTSVLLMMEAQLEHVASALEHMRSHGIRAIEPRPEAQARFVAELDARSAGTVWVRGGCRSWYLDRAGRNSALWPGATFSFTRRVRRFDPEEYRAA